MSVNRCLSEVEIIAENGLVVKNPEGDISVFRVSQSTGRLMPFPLTKPCCEALLIPNVVFDVDTQKCMWSTSVSSCTTNNVFNLVLNPNGNDSTIFDKEQNETCSLIIEFDYQFKFTCGTLSSIITTPNSGSCSSVINVFESIGTSVLLETSTDTLPVYKSEFFKPIGDGKLYDYLKLNGNESGFYICDSTNTGCENIDIYNISGTSNCSIAINQLLDDLLIESKLSPNNITEFKKNIKGDSFTTNWKKVSLEITDKTILDAIEDKKINIAVQVSGSCVDMCVLLDNIKLIKKCNEITGTNIFVKQSPSFELTKTIDNKKSWIDITNNTKREFNITKYDGTSPIRYTDYNLYDGRQVINTKEIDLDINISKAIESDIWGYIIDNPCLLTGDTVGTTTCEKEIKIFVPTDYTVTGTCCYMTAITSNTIVYTSSTTTYSCPASYTATPANDICEKITSSAATYNGPGSVIISGNTNNNYGLLGTQFYPSIQNNGSLPVFYNGGGILVDQTGGTITAIVNNNSNTFWGNSGMTITNGRLNACGLSASTLEYLGFSKCISATTGGTYYIAIAADNYCRVRLNGETIIQFDTLLGQNFRYWNVFPFELNSGLNIFEMEGRNQNAESSFGAEIYKPIDFTTLTGSTSSATTGTIFSTSEKVGQLWDLGTSIGYSCSSGFVLNDCDTPPTCTQILNEPITAFTVTSTTSATTTGYCTDMSCVTYTITSSTVSYTAGTCMPKIYCCSDSCGDEQIDINKLLNNELSGITTIEDFRKLIESKLIDVKNRKTLSSYATLRLLYDRYVNSRNHCQTLSSKFNYNSMDKFANLIGNYWVDLIEQVIPATTIWGATRVYSNTIFDKQKYNYKNYSLLFGLPNYNLNALSPATGSSCNVDVVTSVIVGNSSGTTLFQTLGNTNRYNNLYVTQMNSGSEFIGSVNIIGTTTTNSANNDFIIINETIN